MSNKIVPEVYELVIQNVVEALRSDFEEFGVEDDVLEILRETWRENLYHTRVANFDQPDGYADDDRDGDAAGEDEDDEDEEEDVKPRFDFLAGNGSQKMGLKGGSGMAGPMRLRGGGPKNPYEDVKPLIDDMDGGETGDITNLRHYARYAADEESGDGDADGLGSDDDDENEEDEERNGKSRAGASDAKPVPNERGILPGEEEIGSDLDDSGSEDEEAEEGEEDEEDLFQDVIYCSYEKVQRVKNKWKVVLLNGLIRAKGKEYLFSRCQGEFEW